MDYAAESLRMHRELRGKIEISLRADVSSADALSLAYTPGVAEPCLAIQADPAQSYELTRRWNTVAVVNDGTAVLAARVLVLSFLGLVAVLVASNLVFWRVRGFNFVEHLVLATYTHFVILVASILSLSPLLYS